MEARLLAAAKHRDKCIVTEKEVTYRTARRHRISSSIATIDSPETVQDFMSELFEKSPVEVLYAIALNSSNEFLGFLKLAHGTVSKAAVYPRRLLTFLLVETNASAVILAHNHPGGRATASSEDIALTKSIETMLNNLDVSLLDHMIYAPGNSDREPRWVSLRQEGILA